MTPEASPGAWVLAIGTELLGDKRDLNGPETARRLAARGHEVRGVFALPDSVEEIAAALAAAVAREGLVVVLGGLGPTDDDVTRDALARVTGLRMVMDPASRARLDARFAQRDAVATASSLRQVLVPEGARVVLNVHGSAPGAVVAVGRAVVVLLPGPPRELEPMLEPALDTAEAMLRESGRELPSPLRTATLVLAGIGEGEAYERASILPDVRQVTTAWLARPGEVRLLLRSRDPAHLAAATHAAMAALEGSVVSTTGEALAAVVVRELASREETVTVAESCTGGLVAAALTSVPGSSRVFRQGFVVYSDEAKRATLGVTEADLEQHGAVSSEVALAMASGARRTAQADWAVAVTGIAGPDGGTADKPVGLVWFGLALPDAQVVSHRQVFAGSREDIRLRSVAFALDMVRRSF